MHKKSFVFGLGTGLLVLSALLYFAYSVQLSRHQTNWEAAWEARREELGDEEIFTKATEWGMVFPAEVQPEPRELTDEEIIYRARGLGMVDAPPEEYEQEGYYQNDNDEYENEYGYGF